jgi:hypothetical protein
MEMAGIGEGVQLVSVMINGASQVFALTGHFASYSIEMMIRMFKAINAGRIAHEQKKKELKPGEVLPEQLIKHCSEANTKAHGNISSTAIMQVDDVILEDFEKYANSNKIPYSILYDLNSSDGKTEVMYLSDHSQLIGAFIQENNPHARAYTMSNYLENATAEDINRLENLVSSDSKVKEGVRALEAVGTKGPVYSIDNFSSFCDNYYVAYVTEQDRESFLSFAAEKDIKCAPFEKNQYDGCYIAVNFSDCTKLSESPVGYTMLDAEYFYQETKDYYKDNGIYNERQLSFMKGIARHGYARESEEYLGDDLSIVIDDDIRKGLRNESATSVALLVGEDENGNKMFAKIPRGDIISSTNKDEYDKILLKSRINYQIFMVGKDAQNKPFRNDFAGTYNGKDIVEIRKNYTEALKNSQKRDGVRLVMTDKDGKKISSNPYVKKTDSMSKALEETQNVVKDTRSLSK